MQTVQAVWHVRIYTVWIHVLWCVVLMRSVELTYTIQPAPNAECRERQNHSPLCKCDPGFIGDPFSARYPPPTTPPPPEPTVSDPCDPNPCGLNALARPSDDRCICSCPPGQQGDPYVQCKPEQCAPTAVCRVNNHRADCVVDEECPQVLA